MPQLIPAPHRIPVPGKKIIDEYAGLVNTGNSDVSIAVCVPAFSPDTVHRDA